MLIFFFPFPLSFIPFNDSNHVMSIRYHWPKKGTFSNNLRDLVAKIFQPPESRITMDELLEDPWLLDGGNLPAIPRIPLKKPLESLNPAIVHQMESLGFNAQDVTRAVLQNAHNQLTTTYYLLEHRSDAQVVVSSAIKEVAPAQEDSSWAPTKRSKSAAAASSAATAASSASKSDSNKCIIA